jgi:hypothetical protein
VRHRAFPEALSTHYGFAGDEGKLKNVSLADEASSAPAESYRQILTPGDDRSGGFDFWLRDGFCAPKL